jgi:hypothetical protein
MMPVQAEPQSQFTQRRADYVNLLIQLATQLTSQLPRRVLCCAAELMSYFQNWNEWKRARYREDWFYQPLRKIWQDLTGAYSLHVIQKAIALLVEFKLLSVKKNDRTENKRNGQDKTHRYLVHSDRLKAALAKLFSQSKESEDQKNSQPANAETRSIKAETQRFNVDTYTKIQSLESSQNSYSLLGGQEKVNFVQEDIPDPWAIDEDEVEQEVLTSFTNTQEIPQQHEGFGEDQFSAAPQPKCSEMVQTNSGLSSKPECSEMVQTDLKPLPRLKSDRVSGFRSDA